MLARRFSARRSSVGGTMRLASTSRGQHLENSARAHADARETASKARCSFSRRVGLFAFTACGSELQLNLLFCGPTSAHHEKRPAAGFVLCVGTKQVAAETIEARRPSH
eukprot:1087388-Pleurochrysis_carterae.AAC.1